MDMENEKIKITGTIDSKEANEKNGPAGYFYVVTDGMDAIKFTCWKRDMFERYNPLDEVVITYAVNTNTYMGRNTKYNSIIYMEYKNNGEHQFSKQNVSELKKVGITAKESDKLIKSDNGIIKMGGLFYKIKNIELERMEQIEPSDE